MNLISADILTEDSDRLEPDLQVLIDALSIERIRHPPELDLAVQRLIRNAE